MRTQGVSNQIFVGLAFLLIGLALLLRNLGIADFTGVGRWIPSIFILLGVWQLIANNFRYVTGPLILVVGGALVQLATLGVLPIASLFDLWPLILIVIGGSILFEHSGLTVPRRSSQNSILGNGEDGRLNLLAIFNDPKEVVTSPAFKGGELTVVAGGIDLDLRPMEQPQQTIRLDVFTLIGGVELRLPPEWTVQSDVIGILGGLDDEREDRPTVHNQPDLILSGFALLGGITIK